MNYVNENAAVLDTAHVGDIRGAFGTIARHDTGPRHSVMHRLRTLAAILGPGLIVMVGDNDAGAFGTYTQAGQNYGTGLLWCLLLLIPVLYVNQEMVLRLGAVTGVGHARLIFERFGKFWGAFSVIDLFLLNALTIVTEFIGITLGLDYLGVNKHLGVGIAALVVMAAAGTGDFRRFERFAMALVAGSLLLVPVFLMVHPPVGEIVRDFFIPKLPAGSKLNEVMLLIIAIVGTTVAPWQLFFQQSYVIDKRITPRFIQYERVDLWLGIVLVIVGAVAMMAFTAATFAGQPEFGKFTDAGAVAAGMQEHFGRLPAVFFAIALIDACIIGASAVSLSTAYALGDVLSIRHSLHRKPGDAKGFYAVYCGLIVLAATLVLTPGTPLGLLTNLVQTLAGVLLPSATVFLLLLCNDKAVLGPWVNSRRVTLFTAGVIAVLVMLSVILTASTLFPDITEAQIVGVLVAGSVVALATTIGVTRYERRQGLAQDARLGEPSTRDSGTIPSLRDLPPLNVGVLVVGCVPGLGTNLGSRSYERQRGPAQDTEASDPGARESWRMPPLSELPPMKLTMLNRIWLAVLRLYLAVAAGMLGFKLVQLAVSGGAGG